MATFLKIATETVYKMAGLGAFEASVAYKVNCFRLFLGEISSWLLDLMLNCHVQQPLLYEVIGALYCAYKKRG